MLGQSGSSASPGKPVVIWGSPDLQRACLIYLDLNRIKLQNESIEGL